MCSIDFRNYTQLRHLRRARGKPFVIAHRGASAEAPENTMHAFELAYDYGAHLIETDLWITRDRHIALFHDRTLSRTTGKQGTVMEVEMKALQDIPTLAPGSRLVTSHMIPALTELLEWANKKDVGLLLELKDPRFALPEYGQLLVDLLREYEMFNATLIISFSKPCLHSIRRLSPDLPVGQVGFRIFWPNSQWDLVGPPFPTLMANPLFMPMARRFRSLVAPLDPDPARRIGYYQRIGVDAILADDVAKILNLLKADSPPAFN